MKISIIKPLVVGKSSLFSGMKNDALMHCEGFKGLNKFEGWITLITASKLAEVYM